MGGVARRVVVALGSNLGDRHAHLHHAISRLRDAFGTVEVSTLVESDPVGVPNPQPRYLNGVLVATTSRDARDVLGLLRDVERQRGRERPYPNAPRTLDLDLILCGDEVIDTPGLVVPHPRFRERQFVLGPLTEIAPDVVDPVTGLTAQALLARLGEAPAPRRASAR